LPHPVPLYKNQVGKTHLPRKCGLPPARSLPLTSANFSLLAAAGRFCARCAASGARLASQRTPPSLRLAAAAASLYPPLSQIFIVFCFPHPTPQPPNGGPHIA
jgi:hypothetical protein